MACPLKCATSTRRRACSRRSGRGANYFCVAILPSISRGGGPHEVRWRGLLERSESTRTSQVHDSAGAATMERAEAAARRIPVPEAARAWALLSRLLLLRGGGC